MDSISYIAWIVPTFTDFGAAEQYLQDRQRHESCENLMYSIGKVGQNKVVLVCAAENASIYDAVQQLLRRLHLKHMKLKLCLVGAFGYASTFHCGPAIGDCVLGPYDFDDGYYQISRQNVPDTSLYNAGILLQAANSIVDYQTGYITGDNTMGYIRRECNPEEEDIAGLFCCSRGFEYAPCMSVTGICGYYAGDDNINWVPFATQQASATIASIIAQIGELY